MTKELEIYVPVLICTLSLSGCFSVPNYKGRDKGGPPTTSAKEFKYGKYCGAGHPAFDSSPGTNQRTIDLMSIWPPVDDIDLMCYAHDLCYQSTGSQNLICDQALSATAVSNAEAFSRELGCNNLANLIGAGLGAKVTGTEENKNAALAVAVANAVWTLPVSVLYYASNINSVTRYGLPEVEGRCFIGDAISLHTYQVISDFQAQYREYVEGFEAFTRTTPGVRDVSIPIPIKNWRHTFQIFETQKYLNYFGFNAGTANGVLRPETRDAIGKFAASKNIGVDDTSSALEELKKMYLKVPLMERAHISTFSADQRGRLYHYP